MERTRRLIARGGRLMDIDVWKEGSVILLQARAQRQTSAFVADDSNSTIARTTEIASYRLSLVDIHQI